MDLVRFPVRLPPDVLAELKKSAKWSGISVSAYACQILTKHVRESVGFSGQTQVSVGYSGIVINPDGTKAQMTSELVAEEIARICKNQNRNNGI